MERKAMQRLIAALLICGLFLCGCGRGNTPGSSPGSADHTKEAATQEAAGGEPYTITYAFDVWVQQADWDLVEQNLSDIVEKKIGARVKLMPMTGANYQQQINLMVTSKEKLDLYNASAKTTFSTDVAANKILGLDMATIEKYAPEAMAAAGDFLKASTVNGKVYGFPTLRDMANAYGIIIRKDIAEKYGVDTGKGLTVEELDDLFMRMKEGETDRYVTQPQAQGTSVLDSIFKILGNAAIM